MEAAHIPPQAAPVQGRPVTPVQVRTPPGAVHDAQLQQALHTALDAKPADYTPRTHHLNSDGTPRFLNRLIRETSPYLLQHAHNPVDWRPWGDEAFAAARDQGKPVLMSIGYATCHWCHVMERESFEDVEIAQYINENFIAIKVDREERPDVDDVYMAAVQILSGRGGWPMTTVLTDERKPFFGGTYFPARAGDRGARQGFFGLLKTLKTRYETDREGVVAEAQKLSRQIAARARTRPGGAVPGEEALVRAADAFSRRHDATWGGFSNRPKFPRPVAPRFLLRVARRTGDTALRDQVLFMLDRMAAGGMHDHVGGGFHRYSVDARWLVPHFEKMLYDNAQLTVLYLEGYQLTGDRRLARVARRTLDYVAREMTSEEGAFYSATDADSPTPEGHDEEGYYFTWTPDELAKALTPELVEVVTRYHGVTARGNFEGRNILFQPRAEAVVAAELGLTVEALEAKLVAAWERLRDVRATRPPPILDDKILTAWNGLMISAFARGAEVLGRPADAKRAVAAAEFVLKTLRRADGRLSRTYREGVVKYDGYLEDYAFVIAGLLDLHEATGDARWLEEAVALQRIQDAHYRDAAGGAYFVTAHDAETLLIRDKPAYDGAEPSGNSVSAHNLLRLAEWTGEDRYRKRAEAVIGSFGDALRRGSLGMPHMLSALDRIHDVTREVVLVAPPGAESDAMAALKEAAGSSYLPNRALIHGTAAQLTRHATLVPWVEGKVARKGVPTAYVCERGVCEAPTGDPATLAAQLAAVRRPIAAPGAKAGTP